MRPVLILAVLLGSGVALAQSSASYQLDEVAFNAGGTPSQGTTLSSAGFTLTLASIGDSVAATGLSSGSFGMDVGFDAAYPAPGEVLGLALTDKQTLVWNAEPSAGTYNLYRDDTSNGYGNCEFQNLPVASATDSSNPSPGNAFHYLVTVENRLTEEGTKGFQSDGTTERPGSSDLPICP